MKWKKISWNSNY